jgi:signal peptidase I
MSEQTQISEDVPLHSFSKVLRDWVLVVVLALGAALLVRVYVLQQFYISGPSMETTLLGNNRVLVNKLSYRLHSIRRGDVVVFDRVTTSDGSVAHDDLIKRVIALARDTIEIKDCKVFVNNALVDEPYLNKEDVAQVSPADRCRVSDLAKQTIPEDKIFVMGDNRPESFDSRSFGPISKSLVVGRAFAIVWPLNRIASL